jgi:hypothetical protein
MREEAEKLQAWANGAAQNSMAAGGRVRQFRRKRTS